MLSLNCLHLVSPRRDTASAFFLLLLEKAIPLLLFAPASPEIDRFIEASRTTLFSNSGSGVKTIDNRRFHQVQLISRKRGNSQDPSSGLISGNVQLIGQREIYALLVISHSDWAPVLPSGIFSSLSLSSDIIYTLIIDSFVLDGMSKKKRGFGAIFKEVIPLSSF